MAARTVESALVILPPKDTWPQINEIRRSHDRAFPRWMPHINLIYPFVKDSEFQKEQLKIAKHLSEIRPFTVSLTQGSFGFFTHGKGSTIWVRPSECHSPQDDTTELLQMAPKAVPRKVKTFKTKVVKRPKIIQKTVKRMVKKVIPVEIYDNKTQQVSTPVRLGYPNPNPNNFPVTSCLEALKDAMWNDDVVELKRKPPKDYYGMDLLQYAVWGLEPNIYPEIGGVLKFQKNVPMETTEKCLFYNATGSKKRIEYQEVWEEVEETVDEEIEGSEEEEIEQVEEIEEEPVNEEYNDDDDDGFTVVKSKREKVNHIGAATSQEVMNLQKKLYEMYPGDSNGRINQDFNPHLTLGQCKTINIQATIDKWKAKWKDITFEVKEVHLISRRGNNDNFAIRKTVPFSVLDADD